MYTVAYKVGIKYFFMSSHGDSDCDFLFLEMMCIFLLTNLLTSSSETHLFQFSCTDVQNNLVQVCLFR